MSDTYLVMMQDYSGRILKKLRRSKSANKIASELIAYIKNTYNYDAKVMYDIVDNKIIMVDAHGIENKLDKEITIVDVFIQELNTREHSPCAVYKDTYYETRAKAISLSVAGCSTWRDIVKKMQEEGFPYKRSDNLIISNAISVANGDDKDKILRIYNKATHIFEAAGQSIEDVERWMDSKLKAQ